MYYQVKRFWCEVCITETQLLSQKIVKNKKQTKKKDFSLSKFKLIPNDEKVLYIDCIFDFIHRSSVYFTDRFFFQTLRNIYVKQNLSW